MPIRSLLILSITTAAHAGVPAPTYDFDWAVVTHAGNDPITAPNAAQPGSSPRPVGRVDHNYRMSRNELSTGQWYEFVQAFAPYINEFSSVNNPLFAVAGITFTGYQNGVPRYSLNESRRNRPVATNWYYTALFVNWLHNDKAGHREAFLAGAYDASTWGTDEETHKRMRGARFFLPTYDEWAKAVFFDPDRYGEDQPGFWMYPDSSDTPLIPGAPGEGETSLGLESGSLPYDIGSYPDTMSPWGILDASGGMPEWIEQGDRFDGRFRGVIPSALGDSMPPSEITDQIGVFFTTFGGLGRNGIRIASVIPAPSTAALLTLGALATARRRR